LNNSFFPTRKASGKYNKQFNHELKKLPEGKNGLKLKSNADINKIEYLLFEVNELINFFIKNI
jgi:hypothetical protein